MKRGFVTAVIVLLCNIWVVSAQSANGIPAQVVHTPDDVFAYVLPDEASPLMMLLNGGQRITALGRTFDNQWVVADLSNNGIVGWIPLERIEVHYAYKMDDLPVSRPDEEMILRYAPFWNFDTPHNLEIFKRGQEVGNGMNTFSKVGDSITVAQMYLMPYASGVYNLGEYDYLQHVLDYFGTDENSSFGKNSAAVRTGWSTRDVLNVRHAEKYGCPTGLTPLICEYRFTKPSFALIMLGTNDATVMDVAEFEDNLNIIVEQTIAANIIPVLSTVPPLLLPAWDERPYNHAIIRVSENHDVSLINYWLAVQPLPNYGISDDLVHPSSPPSNAGTTLFLPEYIQYGYTIRNLITLQALDLLLQNAVYPAF